MKYKGVEVKPPEYNEVEKAYVSSLIDKLERAKRMRGQAHDELDGMTYEEYYESNAKAANSYIPPKKNPEDVRIVTGTTEDKGQTLLSAMLNFNLEPNVQVFDKDNEEIVEGGEIAEALIKKSKLIEVPDHEMKWPIILKELLDQGTCFVEDLTIEYTEIEKKISGSDAFKKAMMLEKNWEEKMSKVFREVRSSLIPGTSMYLGNVKEFFMDRQPYFYTREYITYEEAKRLYGNWRRFENVQTKASAFSGSVGDDDVKYRSWAMVATEDNFVEVLKFQSRPNNGYQIILNGVMMLPVVEGEYCEFSEFPLSSLTGRNIYSVVKGDIGPISPFFAYSRSVPARTKVDQRMLDEFYRLVILKTQKSFMPPTINNTGTKLSKKIFYPGSMVDDVSVDDIKTIGDVDGVSSAEFAAIEFIKRQIDEKTVSPVYQGQQTKDRQTATEILELRKQSEKKLGVALWGVSNLVKSMSWLRLMNIIHSWTDKVDSRVNKMSGTLDAVFKKIEVEDTFKDGTDGTRVIEFANKAPSPVQIQAEERLLSKVKQKKVRKFYVNPSMLRDLNLHWYISVQAVERDSDQLERAQFNQTIAEGYQLFGGPQAFQQDYLKSQWAIKNKMNKQKIFVPQEQLMQMQQQQAALLAGQSQPGGGVNDQLRQATRGAMSGRSTRGKAVTK